MGLIRKVLGPRSKYDGSLPYTYVAKVRAVEESDEFFLHYFADTICGLIEYLAETGVAPEATELFGAYSKEDITIPTECCIDRDGEWLRRPDICRSLEDRYRDTPEDRFKGHIERGECSFEDRNRRGAGPY